MLYCYFASRWQYFSINFCLKKKTNRPWKDANPDFSGLHFVVSHRYAASIDDILEEEEHYADQLKEYLFYTDAVR